MKINTNRISQSKYGIILYRPIYNQWGVSDYKKAWTIQKKGRILKRFTYYGCAVNYLTKNS